MFAVIVIPDFSLRAVLRHEPELHTRPVALLADDTRKARICQLTSAALDAGATIGMTSTQAKARCTDILFRIRSLAQEAASDEILLECAYASAAFIEATAPGVCTLDFRGLPLAQEGPAGLERWAMQLLQRLSGCFLPATVGVAAAPGLALQAARKAAPFLHITEARSFWRKLPIEDLLPPAELMDVLRKWGIATAGEFLALGKEGIAERLGKPGLELFEAIRADKIRPLKLTTPRQVYEESFEFEQPVEMLEPLLFMIRRFLDQLTRRMEHALLVIQKLEIALVLESGEEHARTLEIPAPNRNIDILFRIVHNYLENVRTSSAVKGIRLRAQPCPSETRQFQLFETAIRDPNKFYETIGRLNALLGPERVGTPFVEATHRPDSIRMNPVTSDVKALPPPERPAIARGLMLRRFRPPLPANVRLRDSEPVFIRSTRVTASITRSSGPWRSSGNWWENMWMREEWDIETKEGALYRLYRDNDGWFVEGAYD